MCVSIIVCWLSSFKRTWHMAVKSLLFIYYRLKTDDNKNTRQPPKNKSWQNRTDCKRFDVHTMINLLLVVKLLRVGISSYLRDLIMASIFDLNEVCRVNWYTMACVSYYAWLDIWLLVIRNYHIKLIIRHLILDKKILSFPCKENSRILILCNFS